MKFIYQARSKEGKIETGTIEASSKEAASLLLQKYNIFATSLEPQGKVSSFLKIKIETKVSTKELAIFSRQLAVMLESRVPVIQSLTSLAVQTRKSNFKEVLTKVSGLVEEGLPLSEAFSNFPDIFDNFYVSLIKSGELSGKISGTLYYIADHLESEHDIIAQVKQAMIYPAFTICILFVVIGIIITLIVPQIENLIKSSTTPPAGFTLLMLHFYTFLENYWWYMVGVLAIVILTSVIYFRTKKGKRTYDIVSLKIPLLGDILRKVFLTRFCGNVSTLINAGISINKALEITADTLNNSVYKDIIDEVKTGVSEGDKISTVLVKYPDYFPSFVVQMVKVGEETGKLDKTLLEVVNFYQKEIKRAIDLFLTLLEPILIIFLGIVVGIVAISVFAPLYSTLGNI